MDAYKEMYPLLRELLGLIITAVFPDLEEKLGAFWFKQACKNELSKPELALLESRGWQTAADIDLQAALKILKAERKHFVDPESFYTVCVRLLQVRNRYQAHGTSRQPDVRQFADDLGDLRRFCSHFAGIGYAGFAELAERVGRVERIAIGDFLGLEGENSERVAAATLRPAPGRDDRPLEEFYAGTDLTRSQQDAVQALGDFLNSEKKCFILRGYAGTGKTFLLGGLVRAMLARHRMVVLLAPTGRAAHVIQEKTGENAATIHRAIYSLHDVRECENEEKNGTPTYKFYFALKANEYAHDALFVVDESSMISDNYSENAHLRFGTGRLLSDLIEFLDLRYNDSARKQLVFIGDDAQLPPVGMQLSPALDPAYLANTFELEADTCEMTDVVRQSGESGILANATKVRERLRNKYSFGIRFDTSRGDVFRIEGPDLVRKNLECLHTSPSVPSIVVAFTNREVQDYNKIFRESLFPGCAAPQRGDRIIVLKNNTAFGLPVFNGQTGVLVWAAADCQVRRVVVRQGAAAGDEARENPVNLRFREVEIAFPGEQPGAELMTALILENLLDLLEAEEVSLLSKALYIDFRMRHEHLLKVEHRDAFRQALKNDLWFNALQIAYGYALTCHKAQGGEWHTVFVDASGKQSKSDEALRWIYTAYTRASTRLFVKSPLEINLLDPSSVSVKDAETTGKPAVSGMEGSQERMESFLERVIALVNSAMPGVAVGEARSIQSGVRIGIGKDPDHLTLLVYHKANGKVTSVMYQNPSSHEWEQACRDALHERLCGLSFSLSDQAGKGGVTEGAHQGFLSNLQGILGDDGIQVTVEKEYTPYQTRFRFTADAETCTILFYFNAKNRITGKGDVSGSKVLLARVLDTLGS